MLALAVSLYFRKIINPGIGSFEGSELMREFQRCSKRLFHVNTIKFHSTFPHACIAVFILHNFPSITLIRSPCSRIRLCAGDRSSSSPSLPSSSSTSSASQGNVLQHHSHTLRHLHRKYWAPTQDWRIVPMTSTRATRVPEYARQPCSMRGTKTNSGASTSAASRRIGNMAIDGEYLPMSLAILCMRTTRSSTSQHTCSRS